MTAEQFKKANNLRSCGRCCATCIHGRDLMDDGTYQCVHSDLKDERSGLYTDATDVCDKWSGVGQTECDIDMFVPPIPAPEEEAQGGRRYDLDAMLALALVPRIRRAGLSVHRVAKAMPWFGLALKRGLEYRRKCDKTNEKQAD